MKKNYILVAFATLAFTSYSQVSYYNDLGILFSKDDTRGTARFNAMSGAFGALGGDISASDINPAGGVVAKKSNISVSTNIRNGQYTSNYYGSSINGQDTDFDFSQLGAVLVFDSAFSSDWNRFAMTFNYSLKKNFSKSYAAEGNSDFLYYDEHFSDSQTAGQFDRSLNQYISSNSNGRTRVFNLGFSAVHKKKLFVGASVKLHDLEFSRATFFNERNDDIDGNILNIEEYTETYIQGNGVSLNLGFIYKLNKNIRIGLAYETPTWYQEVIEDYYEELYMEGINNLNINRYLNGSEDSSLFSYRSASRITASGAFIFGKQGLLSIDYTYRDFKNIKFENGDFFEENNNFNTKYRNTQTLNIGTEWRFDNMSIRGGVSYEKDPNLSIGGGTNEDNIKSYSFGLGYNFGNSQFDLSYTNSKNTDFYSIYNTSDLNIENNVSQISGTLTFNL